MKALRLPLFVPLVATLVAAALLPLGISFYQLRRNKDALLEQVQHTHIVASSTVAARVEAFLEGLLSQARASAAHPVLVGDPRSPAAQELLRGTLQAQPAIAGVGLFDLAGEQILVAQRIDLKGEIASVYGASGSDEVALHAGATRPWLRLRVPLPEQLGHLVLVADAEPLREMVEVPELGDEAELGLVTPAGELVARAGVELGAFPAEMVAQAASGQLDKGATRSDGVGADDVLGAYHRVAGTTWSVLSRQPAKVAEVAQSGIRRATRVGAGLAVLLTALLAAFNYVSVLRPLRRLIRAQRQLTGAAGSGSEIEQLEQAFKALEERIRDRSDLAEVFLGRYQILDIAGTGSMGTVFRGWDPKLQRPVALKTIRLNSEDFDRQKLTKSLLGEAVTYARFNHPNIVTIFDVLDGGEAACIAMEYVDGSNLETYVAEHGALPVEQVIPLGAKIARALAAAHENGLVHHDVKPANVLLGADNSIKVTDFGVSEWVSSATKERAVVCGTPGYIPPESLQTGDYSSLSDIFALGTMLYFCLSQRHPFLGRNLRHTMVKTITEEPQAIDLIVPSIPKDLAKLVMQMLSKSPADRPQGAVVVAEALEAMADELGLSWSPNLTAADSSLQPGPTGLPSQLISLEGPPTVKDSSG